ncbi:YcxB family protein [Litoreibacter arenae]|uniref:YcxB-like C-terminal domain-containing protein n=1 Tax=Litoreibacter arenae DSM 19593 TaxID=1123360 RepID=S9QK38_9RHOB|nr:YcxB family protein [Litoreibacter arenae]EPX79963.1 hypothetical protein thalar_01299 [Litoreibacter arenae DSM 19593]
MAITLTYSFTEDQFMQAARAFWAYQGIGDRGNLVLSALTGLVGAWLLLTGMSVGWIWIGAAGLFVAITLVRNALWRRGFRKSVKYSAPITARFSHGDVSTDSAEGNSTLLWTTFRKYAETPDYFFLLLPRRGLSILPKHAVQDEWQLETLRDMITSNLPRAKKHWT